MTTQFPLDEQLSRSNGPDGLGLRSIIAAWAVAALVITMLLLSLDLVL